MFEFEFGILITMENMGYRMYKALVKHPWQEWNMDKDGWDEGEWATAKMFIPRDIVNVQERFESLKELVDYVIKVRGRDGYGKIPTVETYETESVR